MQLHSTRGYSYILAFLLMLVFIHFVTHLALGSTPYMIQRVINPTQPITKEGSSPALFIRYLIVRYMVYAALLFVFFLDHIKNPKWLKLLTTKVLSVAVLTAFSVVLSGRVYYQGVPNNPEQFIFGLLVNFWGIDLRVYVLATWICLFLLSFHFLHKKLAVHHALWIAALIFLSCEEVWEYVPYYITMIRFNLPITLLTITLCIWRAGPTFLLLFYARKFIKKLNIPLCACLIASLVISFVALSNYYILWRFSWLLRLSWPLTYVLLAHSIAGGVSYVGSQK